MSDAPLPYSFTEEVAADARRASRLYWRKGGPADQKYPAHRDVERWWKIRLHDYAREAKLEAAIRRMRGER